MLPISDDNPTVTTPWMTYSIIAATLASWFLVQGAGGDPALVYSVCDKGMVPAELTGLRPIGYAVPIARGLDCVVDNNAINWLTPITSIFLHGGWGHLLGNLWFFWVFGNNIEDSMGPKRFVAFYLVCGILAALAHVISSPSSAIPTVGASGAISGIMGAYLVLFPKARVNLLFFFVVFIKTIPVPAWVALLWWFGWQAISALPALEGAGDTGGVAVWAHIGGFIAGVLLIRFFADPVMLARRRQVHAERYPDLASS
ncbi:MAG: rhomboid family intramembrane serine protease [Gemmatimonadota bacterium]